MECYPPTSPTQAPTSPSILYYVAHLSFFYIFLSHFFLLIQGIYLLLSPFPIPSNFSLLFLIKYVFGLLSHPHKAFLQVFILLFSLFCLKSFSHFSLPPDPFEVQVKAGCELHSGKSPEGFFRVAFNGLDLLSFQNTTWVPSPDGGSLAPGVCHLLNHQYEGVTETVYNLIRSTCPRFLLGLLDAGKMYLHRQGQ